MAAIVSAAEAVDIIQDEAFVVFGGSGGGHAVPEAIIEALADRFLTTKSPRDLTLCSIVSLGDWDSTGFNRLALSGLARRIVTAGLNNCPQMASLAARENLEVHVLPQGVLSQLCRDSAAKRPGLITKVGLHTFVDPRHDGGLQSGKGHEERVRLMNIDGEEYLFYRALPVDVAVVRGTTADEHGNISMEEEAVFGEPFSVAAAARNRGGTVIVQVKRVAAGGTLQRGENSRGLDRLCGRGSGAKADISNPDEPCLCRYHSDPATSDDDSGRVRYSKSHRTESGDGASASRHRESWFWSGKRDRYSCY